MVSLVTAGVSAALLHGPTFAFFCLLTSASAVATEDSPEEPGVEARRRFRLPRSPRRHDDDDDDIYGSLDGDTIKYGLIALGVILLFCCVGCIVLLLCCRMIMARKVSRGIKPSGPFRFLAPNHGGGGGSAASNAGGSAYQSNPTSPVGYGGGYTSGGGSGYNGGYGSDYGGGFGGGYNPNAPAYGQPV